MPKDVIKKKIDSLLDLMKKMEVFVIAYESNPNIPREYALFAAEKKAEEVVELATRINGEVLLEYFQHTYRDYFMSFKDLDRLKIFDEKLLEKLAQTAGFRNRLVHEYLGLSDPITVASMKNVLVIYPQYMRGIIKFLDQKK